MKYYKESLFNLFDYSITYYNIMWHHGSMHIQITKVVLKKLNLLHLHHTGI